MSKGAFALEEDLLKLRMFLKDNEPTFAADVYTVRMAVVNAIATRITQSYIQGEPSPLTQNEIEWMDSIQKESVS